jgi:hypothetical protein
MISNPDCDPDSDSDLERNANMPGETAKAVA